MLMMQGRLHRDASKGYNKKMTKSIVASDDQTWNADSICSRSDRYKVLNMSASSRDP